MIGKELRKFAAEQQLTVSGGVAYGLYRGYMVTLSEAPGVKSAAFAVNIQEESTPQTVLDFLNRADLREAYGIRQIETGDRFLRVSLRDAADAVQRLTAYIELIAGQLEEAHIGGGAFCSHCRGDFSAAPAIPVLVDGTAMPVHEGCIPALSADVGAAAAAMKQGNAAAGICGALLGGLAGSIPWAVAYYFGWFVGWLGFLIGIAAKKGYELFHGKESRLKAVTVAAVTVICVILVELLTGIIGWNIEFAKDAELAAYGLSFWDVTRVFFRALFEDDELRAAVIRDLALGLLFAGLGIFTMARDLFRTYDRNRGRIVRL